MTAAARESAVRAIPQDGITFFIDSQAAIKAITATEIKSKLVRCCREELKVLGIQHKVSLCWVPGHEGIPGNEKADELARKGSTDLIEPTDLSVSIPPCMLKLEAGNLAIREANLRWKSMETCNITRNYGRPSIEQGPRDLYERTEDPFLSSWVSSRGIIVCGTT